MYLGKMENKISARIRNTSAAQLGGLSTLFFISMLIYNKYYIGIGFIDICLILLSIILFCISIKLSADYKITYKEDLEYVMRQYKEYLKSKEP